MKNIFIPLVMLLFTASISNAQIIYATGTYTGNGTSLNVIDVGFQPNVVLVKSASTQDGWCATSTMSAGKAKSLNGNAALQSGILSSINTTGFTVASNTQSNSSGTVYHFVCFAAGARLKVGTYTGNGGSTKSVINLSFKPEMVWVLGDAGHSSDFALLGMQSNSETGVRFSNGQFVSSLGISSYDTDGFTVGSFYNTTGQTYHFVAFDEDGINFKQATYTGTSVDNTNIASVGFTPELLLVENPANLGGPFLKTTNTTSEILPFASSGLTSGLIKSFINNGFQLGSSSAINFNPIVYSYAAFTGGSLLPVQFLGFDVQQIDASNASISWSTASEINASYFSVLKSTDGIDFNEIGSMGANGNSNEINNYNFVDDDLPQNGDVYYQLKEFDFDGSFQKTNVVVLHLSAGEKEVKLFPVPTNDLLTLTFLSDKEEVLQYKIVDDLGKTVMLDSIPTVKGENVKTISVLRLLDGVYYLQLSNSKEIISSAKFVVH